MAAAAADRAPQLNRYIGEDPPLAQSPITASAREKGLVQDPRSKTIMEAAENKATIVGEVVKHTSARSKATCEIAAKGFAREDIDVNILTPSKVPASNVLSETEEGLFFVEFVPQEVGTYIMDVYAAGQKIPESPVFYKVYDSSLIRVTETGNGVVGRMWPGKPDL